MIAPNRRYKFTIISFGEGVAVWLDIFCYNSNQ